MGVKETEKTTELSASLEIVKFYHQDWEYRHKNFWSLVYKLFLTNVIINLLPFITSISDVTFHTEGINGLVFPLVGFFVTAFSVFVLYGEAKRLSYVSATRNRIIKECFPEAFRMEEFANSAIAGSKRRLAYAIVVYFGLFQLAVEIAVLHFLM